MRRVEALLALVAYTALALWWLWPLPSLMATHSAYFSAESPLVVADFYLIVWTLAWGAHALVSAPWGLFHANAFHPSTLSLAYSEHLLGDAPLFAPVYWATGNAILATNVFILATFVLSALAMYALVRRFTGPPAALVGGFFYAFYLWRYDALAHLHMLAVQYFPLVFLLTDRWLEAARRRDGVLLAIALVLQALSSYYLAYALMLAYAPFLPLALWRWRSRLDRRRLVGLLVVFLTLTTVVVVASLPYLRLRQLGLIPSYNREGDPPPIGLVPQIAGREVWRYLTGRGVGPVGYALALVAILPPWRGRQEPWLAGVLVAMLGTLAACGPGIVIGGHEYASPYRLVLGWMPGFGTVRLPTRFVLVAQLGFALLAGLGLGRLLDGGRRWVAWPIACVTIALAIWSFTPLPTLPLHAEVTGDELPAAYRWLAAHGEGRPLLDLPGTAFHEAARRMYLSTVHWLPIIDGYSGYGPRTPGHLDSLARGLPGESALQNLVDTVDIGWVLVHRNALPSAEAARWRGPFPRGLEPAGEWGGDLLLRVTRAVVQDRRANLLNPLRTPGGVPLEPLVECPGALRLAAPPPDPWPPQAPRQVQVDVLNLGGRPWPAFGFIPRHLVHLRACIGRPDEPPCVSLPIPLPADVPPGRRVRVAATVQGPFWAGPDVLALRLVQGEAGPLAHCGVAPPRVPIRVAGRGASPPP